MLSVIIPSSPDPLLYKTVESLLESSTQEIEIIPVLDGWSTNIITDPRVKPILLPSSIGMRGAINAGLKKASGDFIMKTDSHCLYAKGFDKVLSESCKENWLMIPRRYSLDDKKWERNDSRPVYDYHYLTYPDQTSYGYEMAIKPCRHHTRRRKNILIDDTMIFQGSCWFANRKYFMEHVGLLDDRPETYGSFACEPAEIGLKYWLGGGEVKVNKNTWYAHLQKVKHHYVEGLYKKTYKKDNGAILGHSWATKHWINNEEKDMIKPFEWLVRKFKPPTWPENYGNSEDNK